MIEFIKEFRIYEEVSVNNKDYLLIHAGLGNYSQEKDIEDYSLHELVWMRADYSLKYFEDTFVITGLLRHRQSKTILIPALFTGIIIIWLSIAERIIRVAGLQPYVWTQEKSVIRRLMERRN